MQVFFTSDLHFGHENVLRFDNRPFKTVDEMDEELIKRWNNKVTPKDIVYVLGDFAFKNGNPVDYYLKRLNGTIYLAKGNHDRASMLRFFDKAQDSYDEAVQDNVTGRRYRVIMSHYFTPFYNGSRHGTIMLYGHTHNSKEAALEEEIKQRIRDNGIPCNAFNVGCMHWNYEPVTISEILNSKWSRYEFPR